MLIINELSESIIMNQHLMLLKLITDAQFNLELLHLFEKKKSVQVDPT